MGSAPRWVRALVTALAAAAVFVGTFLEFYRQESDSQVSPDYIHDKFAGLTGLTLGYLAGLLLVALVWPAPRRKGAVPAPGKDRPTGSFGQRLFALEVWGLFGVSFLPSALRCSGRTCTISFFGRRAPSTRS